MYVSKLTEVVVASDHEQALLKRTQQSAISRWRDRLGHRQNQTLQADLTYESKVISKSLRVWLAASKRLQTNAVIASNAHAYFTQRTILGCWKTAFAQRKREHWLDEKRKADLRALFDRKQRSLRVGRSLPRRMDGSDRTERHRKSGHYQASARR